MQEAKRSIYESEINGCQVTLHFTLNPVDGVLENVQSILSNAYDKRVQNDLSLIVKGNFMLEQGK